MKNNYKILDYIWSKQREFNRNFVDFNKLDNSERQRLTKEYVLHLMSETQDLLDEVNWKIHHKENIVVNRRDLILEWIDVFKYWLSIGLLWDITTEEFFQSFDEKSDLVEQRFLQEFSKRGDGRKVAICDIDGVLSDYPETFLHYVSLWEGDLSVSDTVNNLDLYKELEGKVSTKNLKEYKHRYREGGFIREEGVIEGSKEFLESLHNHGYYIILLTSRPFDKYSNLYLDTYMWLKKQGLVFDALLNDSKKRDKISKILEESKVEFIVDDDPRIVEGLIGVDGLNKIYLVDRSYNRNYDSSGCDKVCRVSSYSQILSKEGVVTP